MVLDELTRRNSDRVELVTFADPRVESAIKKRLSIGGRPVCRHELTRVLDLSIDVVVRTHSCLRNASPGKSSDVVSDRPKGPAVVLI